MLCSRFGHLDIVKYLVAEAHCDINIKDKNGETAVQTACW